MFYVYLWLREDGTPYYVGKGRGDRAFIKNKHRQYPPSDRARILVEEHDSEQDALDAEVFLIAYYGRIDLGTGCLRNMTDGGEGSSGYRPSEATRQKLREAGMGFRNPFFGRNHSLETRSSVASSNQRRVWTPEQREHMRRIKTGFRFTMETRRKMSLTASSRARVEGGKFASTR